MQPGPEANRLIRNDVKRWRPTRSAQGGGWNFYGKGLAIYSSPEALDLQIQNLLEVLTHLPVELETFNSQKANECMKDALMLRI